MSRALRQVLFCPDVDEVVVVAPAGHLSAFIDLLGDNAAGDGPVQVVAGGAERSDSVACGAAALSDRVDLVLVHDAARALAPAIVFERVVGALHAGHGAVVPVLSVTDTIKRVGPAGPDGHEAVVGTLDRSSLRVVQTPQGFTRAVLLQAHQRAGAAVTDDAGLVEAAGGVVTTVAGDARSLKITSPHDLAAAALWLEPAPPAALVVLGGPPGVGKTTLAHALARRRGAAHLRVDTVEQALVRTRDEAAPVGPEGYAVAQSLSGDLLATGLDVVADATNRYALMRAAWIAAAQAAGARCLQVELSCSDVAEHRRRVQERVADIEGHRLPDWRDAVSGEWEPWRDADVRLDTATLSVQEAVAVIEERLT